ncbi:uncharacterized protein LOC127806789 [Diospyros lotus]|uniref:uncharacterized protein LOC127806789 n=1 Tax=Diospyros lotus TaxID=55363 RepID=UPI0022564F39|nr:uncharacterized protein LOC127806789 [Diospyros lotus]
METQKKGAMYVYRMDTGNRKAATGNPTVTKKAVAWANWVMRKSKGHPGNDQDGNRVKESALIPFVRIGPTGRRGLEGGGEAAEGRRSVSMGEMNVASVAAFLRAKVLVSDMPLLMQVQALRCARRSHDSLEKFSAKQLAYNMKKEFDRLYGPAWHCIVGSSFGSFVTHSTGCFLYFSMDKLYVLLFKTNVQRASH